MKILFLFLSFYLFYCSCSNIINNDFLELQKNLSYYCSDSSVSRQDQRLLGHGDLLLPVFSQHYIPLIECNNEQECVSLLFKDWLKENINIKVEKGSENIFHYSYNSNDNYNNEWNINLISNSISGLPVYKISSLHNNNNENYFVKLYSYPQAIDAYHADVFSNYALNNIEKEYFNNINTLLYRKCFIKEKKQIYYLTLTKQINGKSIKDLLLDYVSNKLSKEQLENVIYIAARGLGDLHYQSSSKETGKLINLSGLPYNDILNLKLGNKLPKPMIEAMSNQLQVLEDTASKSIMKTKNVNIPNFGCFSHFDVSTSNVFINNEFTKAIFIDSPLMFRSFTYSSFSIKCETETFLANPLVPLIGLSHPSADYYYFLLYLSLEVSNIDIDLAPILEEKIKEGYCNGWFNNEETINNCINAKYPWTEEIQTYWMQYLVSILAPNKIVEAIKQASQNQQNQ